MKHIVVDLEMNTVTKRPEISVLCNMETIEIGAVMLDDSLQEIASFRTYVKPEYNSTIAPKIQKLTGITYPMVAGAPSFCEAFRMFTRWCLGTGDEVTVYAWSETDFNQICKEMTLKNYEPEPEERVICDRKWSDFQEEFDTRLGFQKQLSLRNALEMMGFGFEGREHDALDDARNTAELLQMFRDEEKFNLTCRKIEEVMKPSNVGISLGSLIDFSQFALA